MKIEIIRKDKENDFTFGGLYINDIRICDTLEPPYEGTKQNDDVFIIEGTKKGNTAIPTGNYTLNMETISPKFKNRHWAKCYNGIVPWITDVPAFERILIHVGNYASRGSKSDTQGCILVGRRFNNTLVDSVKTFKFLMDNYLMPAKKRGEKIYITIV